MAISDAVTLPPLLNRRRWILTGTPILNSAADRASTSADSSGTVLTRLTVQTPDAVGAMLCFLKLCKPFDEPEVWRQYVSKAGDEKRSKLLRVRVTSRPMVGFSDSSSTLPVRPSFCRQRSDGDTPSRT